MLKAGIGQKDPEELSGKKVRRKKKPLKMYLALAAVIVCVLAMGITSMGGPERIVRMMTQNVGDREVEKSSTSYKVKMIESEDEEKALIEREVENGADGIIVQLVSSEDTYAVFEKIDSSVAVMLLETDAVSEGVYSVTAPDNLWIGEALAQTVLQDYGDSLSEKKIGILSGNQNQLSMQQRLGSVKKLLEDENIEPVWILSGQGENLSSELVTKQADEPVDILITLGNAETETAVDYLQADTSYKRQFMIYGEGCSDKTVYYLDKGIIKSLVVPNEFNMGYQSVHTIAEQIKYKFSSAERTTVESLVINRQNLYDEENQKILFPIVQ